MNDAAAAVMKRPGDARVAPRLAVLDGAGAVRLAKLDIAAAPLTAEALASQIRSGVLDAAIIDLQLVTPAVTRRFVQALEDQPGWSDFPFVLLGPGDEAVRLAAVAAVLGNCRLLNVPADPVLLGQAVAAVLRDRARQRRNAETAERDMTKRRKIGDLLSALERRVRDRLAELKENEQLHRHTIELTDQIVWTTEPDGGGLSISPRFYELTGLPPGAMPREAVHPDDYDAAVAAWQGAIASGLHHDHEFRFRMRDGSYRHFRARSAPRKDAAGRMLRWYGTFEDVHERKLETQARAEAQERYQLAARATNDAIYDYDSEQERTWWSPTAARLFGFGSRALSTGLGWWEERIHPEDRTRIQASYDKVLGGRRNRWSGSYRFRKKDGSYADILDRGFMIRDAEGQVVRVVGAMADRTERRQTQAEIQRMKAELIHVSRLSAMGALASTLAHELNQPLTAVTGYIRGSRRLLGPIQEPVVEQVLGALAAAEAQALRAGQIVRRLRELVARGNVAVRPEDVGRLLADAGELAFVDEQLHGVSHRIETDETARWVEADRIQIQQVIINLVRNAVQALADQPRREILIATRPAARDLIEISVADTGTGLSDERKAALFSPFDTSKEEGLGIGLSISRTIVEAHGGKIWAENNEAGGATFRFTLPRAEPPEDHELAPELFRPGGLLPT